MYVSHFIFRKYLGLLQKIITTSLKNMLAYYSLFCKLFVCELNIDAKIRMSYIIMNHADNELFEKRI